jgi:hypothetical protein
MIEVPQDAPELMLDRGSPVPMTCPECKRARLYESRASESQRHAQTLRELHQRRRLVLDESAE